MPVTHRLLAIAVAVLWGVNFVAIDAALDQFPPLLAVALRFGLIAVPTVLLVPWPRVPVRWLLLYGAGFGTLQFLFLYWGMAAGMPAGLASLVLQCSAPFTVLLGAALLSEPLRARQLVGIAVAVVGLVVVGRERGAATGVGPFLLVVAGGLGWAFGNLGNRLAVAGNPDVKPLHLVLWMSVVPPLPMLAASLVFEGTTAIGESFTTLGTRTGLLAIAGMAYTVLLGTLLGSGLWTALMARHPAGRVAPYSMLVPVAGITAAWLLLAERPTPAELVGSALVVAGVLWASTRGRPLARVRPADGGEVVSTSSTSRG